MQNVEIRVRPVVRYIVTRHTKVSNTDGSETGIGTETLGEFLSAKQANRVAVALHGHEYELQNPNHFPNVPNTAGLTLVDE